MARLRLHVDAIGGGYNLRMESGTVREQAIICITLELLKIGRIVRARHHGFCDARQKKEMKGKSMV